MLLIASQVNEIRYFDNKGERTPMSLCLLCVVIIILWLLVKLISSSAKFRRQGCHFSSFRLSMSETGIERVDGPLSDKQRSPYYQETISQKIHRKTVSNPLVPAGVFLTTCALVGGLRAFTKGNTKKSNLFMRYRVAAQGFTVVALLVGTFYTASSSSRT